MQTLLYFSKNKHLQDGFFIFHYNQVPQLFLTFSELIYAKLKKELSNATGKGLDLFNEVLNLNYQTKLH